MRIEGELVEGRFIERLNRFIAVVEIDGVRQTVHVPNTGRLKELLVEGAAVLVRKFNSASRKTQFGLLLVKSNQIWVSVDSANVPNKIVHEALINKEFEQFRSYNGIRREVAVGGSRFDFGLSSDEQDYFIEVKGVTLVEAGTAYFPDAPTTRGTRHLEELAEIKRNGIGAGVIFIIQREDADLLRPNDRTDTAFGNALRKAQKAGVDFMAYVCSVDAGRRQIDIVRQIPVVAG